MSYHWNQFSHSASSALHYHPKFTILLDLLLSPLSQTQIPPCWGQTSFSKGSSLPDSCWGGSLPACWLLVPWSQPSQALDSSCPGAVGHTVRNTLTSLPVSSSPHVPPSSPLCPSPNLAHPTGCFPCFSGLHWNTSKSLSCAIWAVIAGFQWLLWGQGWLWFTTASTEASTGPVI